jgi:hypothetical protein
MVQFFKRSAKIAFDSGITKILRVKVGYEIRSLKFEVAVYPF